MIHSAAGITRKAMLSNIHVGMGGATVMSARLCMAFIPAERYASKKYGCCR